MMRRIAWGSVTLCVAVLGGTVGCSGGGSPASAGGGSAASSGVASSSSTAGSVIDSACPDDRWVGVVPPGTSTCPQAPSTKWLGSPLFTPSPLMPPIPGGYCLYEWQVDPQNPDEAANPGLLPSGFNGETPMAWLDRDCQVVAPLAGNAETATLAVTPALQAAYLKSIEAPPLPLPPLPPGLTVAPVEVAIIDAWPSAAEPGNSPHGFAMAGLVDELSCPALGLMPCPSITTVPRLGLNLLAPRQPRPFKGGFFGFQAHLARSIGATLNAWSPGQSKLIVNLSLGWDKRFNAGNTGPESRPVLAVKDAIRHAACQGALVMVAAGNSDRANLGVDEGPMFPAAWELVAAPTVDPLGGSCAGSPVMGPLLHAVGGVEGTDEALSNRRIGGRPRLATPAFQVPSSKAPMGAGLLHLGPYTGSSVSAATASGIAAVVWHFAPALSPLEVVGKLLAGSETLGAVADFCLGGAPCGPIHRLSLCRALASTGAFPALDCSTKIIPAGKGTNGAYPSAAVATYEMGVPLTDASTLTGVLSKANAHCKTDVFVSATTPAYSGETACPSEDPRYDDAVNEVAITPQPGCPPCPACSFAPGPTAADPVYLDLAIDPGLGLVTPTTVTLWDRAKAPLQRYDLFDLVNPTTGMTYGAEGFRGGSVYRIKLPGTSLVYNKTFFYATIEWIDSANRTQTQSALLVY